MSETSAQIWSRILKRLRHDLGEDVFTSWFLRLELESVEGGVVTLSIATRFLRNWIVSHFKEQLISYWSDEIGTVHRLDVRVRGALRAKRALGVADAAAGAQAAEAPSTRTAPARRMADLRASQTGPKTSAAAHYTARTSTASYKPSGEASGHHTSYAGGSLNRADHRAAGKPPIGDLFAANQAEPVRSLGLLHSLSSALDRRFRFESFCRGDANCVAFEAARTIAEAPEGAPVLYNPLYLHGGVGLGKTHLLQACANAAGHNGRQVVYLTAERFMSNFVQALRNERALQFKEQLRAIDLLLIDDMQFLTGKSIQNEFCHMLNALIDGGKQVVVAADRAAADLEALDERVRSRLQGGAAVRIGTPDQALRREILNRRLAALITNLPAATAASLDIPDVVLDYVASVITTNGRDLDGALNRLICHASSIQAPLSLDVAERALSDLIRYKEPRKVKIEDIQKIVSQHYNVSRADLISARRTRTIVLPRQIAMYLAKSITPRSLPEIGKRFGDRDHTTVLHAVRKIEAMVKQDSKLYQEIELLKRLVEE